MSNQATIAEIKAQGLPVIIFGADVVGEVIYHACRDAGIDVTAFCDNNKNKIDRPWCGLEIIHAPEVPKRYDDAIFMIASTYIRDITAQLDLYGYKKRYDAGAMLRSYDIYRNEYSRPMHFVEFSVGACLLSHNGYMDPNRLYLRGVDLIITEKCSMKCKDCANLMQFYDAPINMEMSEIEATIEKFCSIIDEVYEVRVIGGEPLMNKEYHVIIDKLTKQPKVKRVVVYTNGTIMPKDEHIAHLQSEKVIFIITDYDELSRNLAGLTAKLKANGIDYVVQKAAGWTDSGGIRQHHRTDAQLEETFKYCCVKNYTSISDGKLYRCPFSANAARLHAAPQYEEDYFDMFKETEGVTDLSDVKARIRSFLSEKKFLRTCDFCNGRTYGSPEITPALQTKKPLAYLKFAEV